MADFGTVQRGVAIIAAIAALALVLPAARWALADRHAARDPKVALGFAANHPDALENAAARALDRGDAATAGAFARRAVAARPLEARPYRLLAATFLASDRLADARAAFRAAIAVSPNDANALLWLASDAFIAGRHADGIAHADRALRAQPPLAPDVFPALIDGLSIASFREPLAAALDADPAWRWPFLSRVLATEAPTPGADALLDALQRRRGLDPKEAQLWLAWLDRARRFDELTRAWRHGDRGSGRRPALLLRDGSFSKPPDNRGLGWHFERVAGARIVQGTTSTPGVTALRIDFLGQRVPFRHVHQRLLLAPGAWTLDGQHRAQGLRTPRGLHWVVRCDGAPQPIASGPTLAGNAEWRPWRVAFVVPDDCPAQRLQLEVDARGPSDEWLVGTYWASALSVARGSAATDAVARMDVQLPH